MPSASRPIWSSSVTHQATPHSLFGNTGLVGGACFVLVHRPGAIPAKSMAPACESSKNGSARHQLRTPGGVVGAMREARQVLTGRFDAGQNSNTLPSASALSRSSCSASHVCYALCAPSQNGTIVLKFRSGEGGVE